MAYNQFTLRRVRDELGVPLTAARDLFPGVPPRPTPAGLRGRLRAMRGMATTEAARAQFLIAPVLAELYLQAAGRIALYAGERFDVDEAAGLSGFCDAVVCRPPQNLFIDTPVLMVVEAKNEDMTAGVGQCAAELVAARRANAARTPPTEVVHGAVSDGVRWRFLRIDAAALTVESDERDVSELDAIFGILWHVCGLPPDLPVVP